MLSKATRGALASYTLVLLAGCGKEALTHRVVDTPKGIAYQLGAPKNKVFSAEIATARDSFRIRAYEHSECDKIRFKVVSRVEETLRGDEVVETQPMGPVQVVEATEAPVPCNDRFATSAEVALSAGTATYVLGRTDRFGELEAGLSEELKQSLYGDKTPGQMKVLIERQDVATISMAELAKHEQRTALLVAEFKALLDQPSATPADVSRSYTLYEQLQQLDRGNAEIRALNQRFFELVYRRKAVEANEQLKRNLEALSSAKELLQAPGAAGIPSFVRATLSSGAPTGDVIEWALGRVALTVHEQPSMCSKPFTWDSVSIGLSADSRVAFSVARYQYNDGFPAQVQALCGN